MIQHKKRNFPVKVLPEVQIVTPETVITTLRGMCEQRFHAYMLAPAGINLDNKFKAIQMIRIGLHYASTRMHWREKLRYCLKLEDHFKVIAPRKTPKAYENYMAKLDSITGACKEAILWRAQA